MSWWEAAVLGVIQGLTEFFPVSSSGHLVMGGAVLGLEIPGILFEVAVHVATLVSVLFVYRLRIWTLIRGIETRWAHHWVFLTGVLAGVATMVSRRIEATDHGRDIWLQKPCTQNNQNQS